MIRNSVDVETQTEVFGVKRSTVIRQFLLSYSKNSSIHGIKYVFGDRKNWFTRFFWAVAVLSAFAFSGIFLCRSFVKWRFEPDIGTKTETLNIRKVPFPSVTICPQTKTRAEVLSFQHIWKNHHWNDNVIEFSLQNVPEKDANRFESLLHVCDQDRLRFLELDDAKLKSGHDIISELRNVSYSVEDVIHDCVFRNNWFSQSSDLFQETFMEGGVCYSFNMIDNQEIFNEIISEDFNLPRQVKRSSWSLDQGYEKDDLSSFPYPIISQISHKLEIDLKAHDVDLDYDCTESQGFKVYLHLPNEYPSLTGKHLFVPLKCEVTASMTVHVTKTSEKLNSYNPSQRNCYLTNERPLKFFKNYTKNACDLECFSNYTMNACGCVMFWMPRDDISTVCDFSQINCTIYAKQNMMLEYKMERSSDCDCLPSCTEINYEMESSQTNFDFQRLYPSDDLEGGVIFSSLTVFFQEPRYLLTKRYPLFNYRDYLASCGGALGLFMGFSILSLFEFIYYCICLMFRLRATGN